MMSINWDRLLYVLVLCIALFLAAFVGTHALESMTHPVGY